MTDLGVPITAIFEFGGRSGKNRSISCPLLKVPAQTMNLIIRFSLLRLNDTLLSSPWKFKILAKILLIAQ
ncbi:hypothetical protein ACH95_11380 [Bacillus glycinifermentans]|nr:hypothetical protein ACH95_11380 [Bacillus glycinifermentans]